MRRIEAQVARAERAIEAISAFASRSRPTLVAVSLQRCLTEALESKPLPATVEVSVVDAPGSLPAVLVDASQLQDRAREPAPQRGRGDAARRAAKRCS
ncbi:MAG: hypothetical protein V3V67_04455 [Myxococcota bacterium]